MNFDALPMEMISAISFHLPIRDCMALAATCKLHWALLSHDDGLWKHECYRRWPNLLALHFLQPESFPDTLRLSRALDKAVDISRAFGLLVNNQDGVRQCWRHVARQCKSGSFTFLKDRHT